MLLKLRSGVLPHTAATTKSTHSPMVSIVSRSLLILRCSVKIILGRHHVPRVPCTRKVQKARFCQADLCARERCEKPAPFTRQTRGTATGRGTKMATILPEEICGIQRSSVATDRIELVSCLRYVSCVRYHCFILYATADMQHDLPGSFAHLSGYVIWPELGSNFRVRS